MMPLPALHVMVLHAGKGHSAAVDDPHGDARIGQAPGLERFRIGPALLDMRLRESAVQQRPIRRLDRPKAVADRGHATGPK